MSQPNLLSSQTLIFNQLFILFVSIVGASLYAIYATLRFSDDKLFNQYYYVVPIVIPFVAFMFDRTEMFYQRTKRQIFVDALVVLTAMWRVIGDVPYVSGHTLFLTYILFSSRSPVAFVGAAIVMLEVIYLKYFVWHDWITATMGIILGILAAIVSWRFKKAKAASHLVAFRLVQFNR